MLAVLVLVAAGNAAAFVYGGHLGMFFEWKLVRTWNKVCEGLGGNFKREAPSWRYGVINSLGPDGEKKIVYPELSQVSGTADNWRALIKPNPGQRLDDYTKNADAFALAFRVQSVTFQMAQKGCIAIKAGQLQTPASYGFED